MERAMSSCERNHSADYARTAKGFRKIGRRLQRERPPEN